MAVGNRQLLRRRIRGIRETSKVTRAMELIANARMRRAEQRALNARPYASHLHTLMARTLGHASIGPEHPYLSRPPDGPAQMVHLTADRGLCGGLNARLNHALGEFVLQTSPPVYVATVGRRGRDFVLRSGLNLTADFTELGDAPAVADLRPLCRLITDAFVGRQVDRVFMCYPQFVGVTSQQPVIERLLPVAAPPTQGDADETLFEPDPPAMLEFLLLRYVEANVYRAYLERVASEYAARLVAMHNATESARDLVEDMTVELNRSRQADITEEISDVIAATELLAHGGTGE